MKKTSFFLSKKIIFTVLLSSIIYIPQTLTKANMFTTDGKISNKLKEVLSKLGKPVENLSEANTFAQAELLRSGERWDVQHETSVRKKITKRCV